MTYLAIILPRYNKMIAGHSPTTCIKTSVHCAAIGDEWQSLVMYCAQSIEYSKSGKAAKKDIVMKRNVKRKMPIATIVAGILFVGMLGTTIYSVGEMQKIKNNVKPVPVQVVEVEKEAPVQIVEVEKECPVLDDGLKQEYIEFLDQSVALTRSDQKKMLALADMLNSNVKYLMAKGDYKIARSFTKSVEAVIEGSDIRKHLADVYHMRLVQLRGH